MASILDVAKYILSVKGNMTAMKLEKLCYYSQAWMLAWEEIPMFDDEFEAWANGPVSPHLFSYHRGKFIVTQSDFPDSYGGINLNSTQTDVINKVINYYGDKEPNWLSELTHLERPWKAARERAHAAPGDYCTETISKDEMMDYYSGL